MSKSQITLNFLNLIIAHDELLSFEFRNFFFFHDSILQYYHIFAFFKRVLEYFCAHLEGISIDYNRLCFDCAISEILIINVFRMSSL